MKVFINGEYYDAEKTPIFILFDSVEEKAHHINNMSQLVNAPHDKDTVPAYVVYPGSMTNQEIWSLFDEINTNLKGAPSRLNPFTHPPKIPMPVIVKGEGQSK